MGKNCKNTGIRRAILPKCKPVFNGRLGHTGSAIIMKTGQANHLKALTVQWTEIFSSLLDKAKILQVMNEKGHQKVLGRQL